VGSTIDGAFESKKWVTRSLELIVEFVERHFSSCVSRVSQPRFRVPISKGTHRWFRSPEPWEKFSRI